MQRRIHTAASGIHTVYQGDLIWHETASLENARRVAEFRDYSSGHSALQGSGRAAEETREAYGIRRGRAIAACIQASMAKVREDITYEGGLAGNCEGDIEWLRKMRTNLRNRIQNARKLP